MNEKVFLKQILDKSASNIKHVVLPEGEDERMIAAVKVITEKKIAKITMLGDDETIIGSLKKAGADINAINVINPLKSKKLPVYIEQFFSLRKAKGITEQQAAEAVKDVIYFGTMMLQNGDCDGLVAGAVHSTANTVRPALQIVKATPGLKTVSSMFFMVKGGQTLLFSDCGLVEFPTEDQLVDISLSTAKTAIQFDFEPRIAMLSYSTKGSAKSEQAIRVANAARRAREKLDEIYGTDKIKIDGELQFDAAYVPAIAARKAPDSPIAGAANVFIFPNISAGNICYKSTERLGGYDAYGPILQGLNKPINDLSRGCSTDDIIAIVAITAIQAM